MSNQVANAFISGGPMLYHHPTGRLQSIDCSQGLNADFEGVLTASLVGLPILQFQVIVNHCRFPGNGPVIDSNKAGVRSYTRWG